MPSAFAHVAVGSAIATNLPGPLRRPLAIVLLGALAAAPDLDVIGLRLGIPYGDPLGHRGLTHSLAFAAAIGVLSFPIWRRLDASTAARAAVVTALAVASHGVLDAFTDGGLGVGLFIPLDDTRFFAPFRPLLTSPLSPRAFFAGRGVSILANEALWIGPLVLVLVIGATVARGRKREEGTSCD